MYSLLLCNWNFLLISMLLFLSFLFQLLWILHFSEVMNWNELISIRHFFKSLRLVQKGCRQLYVYRWYVACIHSGLRGFLYLEIVMNGHRVLTFLDTQEVSRETFFYNRLHIISCNSLCYWPQADETLSIYFGGSICKVIWTKGARFSKIPN
jgi:hypothetical protein